MFTTFAEQVAKAHMQLMEGAITYYEFFCFCAARIEETVTNDGYEAAEAEAKKEFEAVDYFIDQLKQR